jgi:hypothetical protein
LPGRRVPGCRRCRRLRRGIDGRGETVVVGPEPAAAPPSSDIRQDLAAFDTTFGLPAAGLNVVNTIAESATPYLAGDEEVTDTEMVHAIAPGATLGVVLVPADAVSSTANITAAITKVIQAGVALPTAVVAPSGDEGAISSHEGPPAPPAASPMWPPTRNPTPPWRWNSVTANSGRTRAPAPQPRYGRA